MARSVQEDISLLSLPAVPRALDRQVLMVELWFVRSGTYHGTGLDWTWTGWEGIGMRTEIWDGCRLTRNR